MSRGGEGVWKKNGVPCKLRIFVVDEYFEVKYILSSRIGKPSERFDQTLFSRYKALSNKAFWGLIGFFPSLPISSTQGPFYFFVHQNDSSTLRSPV